MDDQTIHEARLVSCMGDDDITHVLKTTVKAEAGQMMSAKEIGAPHSFLYKRFPTWKVDSKTYMIPPVFIGKSTHEIGVKGSVTYSDPGESGENVVYKLLRDLGELRKIGMFVFHGFELKDIAGWNKKKVSQECKIPDRIIPSDMVTKECDFIIFHHSLEVISIEVKNPLVKVHNSHITSAETQFIGYKS